MRCIKLMWKWSKKHPRIFTPQQVLNVVLRWDEQCFWWDIGQSKFFFFFIFYTSMGPKIQIWTVQTLLKVINGYETNFQPLDHHRFWDICKKSRPLDVPVFHFHEPNRPNSLEGPEWLWDQISCIDSSWLSRKLWKPMTRWIHKFSMHSFEPWLNPVCLFQI